MEHLFELEGSKSVIKNFKQVIHEVGNLVRARRYLKRNLTQICI